MSFSRIGMITLAITLVLAVLLLGRWMTRAMRIGVAVLLVVAAAIAAPLLGDVFTAAGEEAGGSAEYRSDLGVLIGEMRALGITTSWTVLPTGETYYGSFQSIDSELVLTGLRFGILPLVALVVALVACVLGLLRGRATPAAVAVAAQIPAFATVALITQYGYLAWFLAGVAVTSYKLERADSNSQPGSRQLHHRRWSPKRAGVKAVTATTSNMSVARAIGVLRKRWWIVLIATAPRRGRRIRGIQHRDADLPLHGLPLLLVAHGLERLRHQPGFRLHAGADAVVRQARDLVGRPRSGGGRARRRPEHDPAPPHDDA